MACGCPAAGGSPVGASPYTGSRKQVSISCDNGSPTERWNGQVQLPALPSHSGNASYVGISHKTCMTVMYSAWVGVNANQGWQMS
jgi:hypothetical protein